MTSSSGSKVSSRAERPGHEPEGDGIGRPDDGGRGDQEGHLLGTGDEMEARGQGAQALLQEGDGARQRLVPETDEDQQQDDQDDAADGHQLHQMQDRADPAVPGAVEGCQPGEDEADEDDDVEQALDHDGADDGEPRDAVAPAEEIGAHQLAQPGRQQIVGGIAHQQAVEDLAEAQGGARAPAGCASASSAA